MEPQPDIEYVVLEKFSRPSESENRDQLTSENLARIVPESSSWSQERADFEKPLENSEVNLAGKEETSGNNLPKITINVTGVDKSLEAEINHDFQIFMKEHLQELDPSHPRAQLIRNNDIKIVCHGVLPSKDLTSENMDESAPESETLQKVEKIIKNDKPE